MIKDGTAGTQDGDGLKQTYATMATDNSYPQTNPSQTGKCYRHRIDEVLSSSSRIQLRLGRPVRRFGSRLLHSLLRFGHREQAYGVGIGGKLLWT